MLSNWVLKTLESPLDSEDNKPVHPKGYQPWMFIGRTDAEAPILWPHDAKCRFTGKDPDAGKNWGQEEKGVTEDEMVGWHHWLSGHEFEQTQGDSERQGNLVCCSSWSHGESDTTWQLNNNNNLSIPTFMWVFIMNVNFCQVLFLYFWGNHVVFVLLLMWCITWI